MTAGEFQKHRSCLGWTQKETAAALGLTVQQVSHVENKRTPVSRTVALLFSLYRFPDQPNDLTDYVARGREDAKTGYPQRALHDF